VPPTADVIVAEFLITDHGREMRIRTANTATTLVAAGTLLATDAARPSW
jgi:hypothetical protein